MRTSCLLRTTFIYRVCYKYLMPEVHMRVELASDFLLILIFFWHACVGTTSVQDFSVCQRKWLLPRETAPPYPCTVQNLRICRAIAACKSNGDNPGRSRRKMRRARRIKHFRREYELLMQYGRPALQYRHRLVGLSLIRSPAAIPVLQNSVTCGSDFLRVRGWRLSSGILGFAVVICTP